MAENVTTPPTTPKPPTTPPAPSTPPTRERPAGPKPERRTPTPEDPNEPGEGEAEEQAKEHAKAYPDDPTAPTPHEMSEARRVTGNLPVGDPRREAVYASVDTGREILAEPPVKPDDTETSSLRELAGEKGLAPTGGEAPTGPVKVVPKESTQPETETIEKLDMTPVTMDVQPDSITPGGSSRTVIVSGTPVKVDAGHDVSVPTTVASVLANAAESYRTEQIRLGGVPPVLDLTTEKSDTPSVAERVKARAR